MGKPVHADLVYMINNVHFTILMEVQKQIAGLRMLMSCSFMAQQIIQAEHIKTWILHFPAQAIHPNHLMRKTEHYN